MRTSREGRERRLEKADAAIAEILEHLQKTPDPSVRKRGRRLTTDGAQPRRLPKVEARRRRRETVDRLLIRLQKAPGPPLEPAPEELIREDRER